MNLRIRLAESDADRAVAAGLINRRYASRGYFARHEMLADDRRMTFLAEREGRAIGTVTLVADGPGGLGCDRAFSDLVDAFRSFGRRPCELTRLAFEGATRPMLAALFGTALDLGGGAHRCDDLFIEVNPRHVGFYRRALGFAPIGDVRTNEKIGAPAQLMARLVDGIRANAKRGDFGLYRYFAEHA